MPFALCADLHRDQAIRPLVEKVLAFLVDQVGVAQLEAVILTGSLARGEGSVLFRPDGIRLLGDIEFLVILKAPFDWIKMRRQMVELSRQATRELGENGRVASIEYAPAGTRYLTRAIRPCIFAYDLRHHGKVVWGRTDILAEIRSFGAEAIPHEDAVELIMNRMVELLLLEVAQQLNNHASEARAYHVVKIILDLAGSVLAFVGKHVALYSERPKSFAALYSSSADLVSAIPNGQRFLYELNSAASCKLAPTEDLLFRGELKERGTAISIWAKNLWQWEMRQILDRPSAQFSELLEDYMKYDPLIQRLKGWAKFYCHPLRPTGTISPLRMARLFFQGSPRSLVYAAALMAYQGMAQGLGDWEKRAELLLPISVRPGHRPILDHVGQLWRWLIRNN